jgi:hypothetical protein
VPRRPSKRKAAKDFVTSIHSIIYIAFMVLRNSPTKPISQLGPLKALNWVGIFSGKKEAAVQFTAVCNFGCYSIEPKPLQAKLQLMAISVGPQPKPGRILFL